ncbi:MAG: tetratricopeptide repeat protein [Bacteroidia bacterium]|nr:tetratricopeptide repeat protein [Bacteroidia bacterium]
MKPLIITIILLIPFVCFSQRQTAEKYKNAGNEKVKEGDYQAALENFTKAISIDPTYAAAYNNRGNVKMTLEKYNEAIEDFTKAIELDATDPAFYINRALTKTKMNKPKDAIEDYAMAITLKPNDTIIYQKRGLLRYDIKDYKGAVSDMDKSIALDSENPDLYYYRGLFKLSSFEYSDGHNDLFKAAAMGHLKAKMLITEVFFENIPDDEIFNLRVKSSMKYYLKDFAGAIKDLDELIKRDSKNGRVYLHRGIAKINTGNSEDGCDDLKKALKYGEKEAEILLKTYCK